MLAKVAPSSNDFHALARYLVRGKPGTTPHPNRVAWVLCHNLPSDEPELAATYMAATAQRSARVKNAAYHLMIAWHERERPTPELMQTVAVATLEKAGLAEHQALIMGHGDKPHPHLHILLNRVHPDTGRAWKAAHDYARFDGIMRELAEAHGFEHAPAHQFNPELTDELMSKPDSAATYAARRGAPTSRPQWSNANGRALGAKLSEDLTHASAWSDVETALAAEGLTLEAKGQGLVAGDRSSYVKFSRLGLTISAMGLARRFGEPFARRRLRPILDVDGIDILRALQTIGLAGRDDVNAAIREARRQRLDRQRHAPMARQMSADIRNALKQTTSLSAAPSKKPNPVRMPARASASRGR